MRRRRGQTLQRGRHQHALRLGGGVLINENAQTLDEDDEPIPGLYVCDCDASGLYGDSMRRPKGTRHAP